MIIDDRLEEIDKEMLDNLTEGQKIFLQAYNLRKNGCPVLFKNSENIEIVPKKDLSGIDVYIKEGTKNESLFIPVIITKGGIDDKVYNDFHIGKNAVVTILAGCGVHNCEDKKSIHSGIHRFFLEEGSQVKYIEKHYGSGSDEGIRELNPITEVFFGKDSSMEMETTQIKGVNSTIRETNATLADRSKFLVKENIFTHNDQCAKTIFNVIMDGIDSSCHLISRAVAINNSVQDFISRLEGNNKSYAHSECDAIVLDNAKATATPVVIANSVDATLIHEATIGKIAGEQLTKLMTLGINEEEAEKIIINGFLK